MFAISVSSAIFPISQKKLGRIKTEPYTQCQRNQRNCKMKLLDLTLPSPAENLACDEVLLDCRGSRRRRRGAALLGTTRTFRRRRLCEQGGDGSERRGVRSARHPDSAALFRRRHRGARSRLPQLHAGSANHRRRPAPQHRRCQPVHHAPKPRGD